MARAAYEPPRLRLAATIVRAGGVIAYPTEGVYGLGCRPDAASAVARVITLKGRAPAAGFILLADELDTLRDWIAPTQIERSRLRLPAMGPRTWIVTASHRVPAWITGGRDTVAVRVTTHPLAAALTAAVGMPIVSTSANRHGHRPARSAVLVRRLFGGAVDYVLGGATQGARGPSEIRDARTGSVLRAG